MPAPGTALTYVYTTRDEIERLMSGVGVRLRVDDLIDSTDPDYDASDIGYYFQELTEDATLTIDQYAEGHYDPEDLVNSRWGRIRATWSGADLLSQRRGNPALFYSRYEEIIGELQQVTFGNLVIPGLPTRADLTPAMSNLRVDERFMVRKLRVMDSISTGGTSARQDFVYIYPYEWL